MIFFQKLGYSEKIQTVINFESSILWLTDLIKFEEWIFDKKVYSRFTPGLVKQDMLIPKIRVSNLKTACEQFKALAKVKRIVKHSVTKSEIRVKSAHKLF